MSLAAHGAPAATPATSPELAQRSAPPGSLLDVANALLRGRRLIILATLLLPTLMVGRALLSPSSYTASAAFMPQARRGNTSAISGLASQFGIAVGSDAGNPVPLYSELLLSRAILGPVAARTYTVHDDEEVLRGPLEDVLRVTAPRPELRREYAMLMLRNATRVIPDPKTGIIRLSVTEVDAEFARTIVAAMLEELNRFNLETRQSQATAERKFAERRLSEIRGELADAERRQEQFLRENREYRSSPQLFLASQRLDREVAFRQQLFVSYAQAFEQAKVDEVRDTPVISVIEPPERSYMPNRRFLIVKGLTGLTVGFVLSSLLVILIALVRPYLQARGDALAGTRALWRETVSDILHPWRLLRRNRPAT